MLNSWRKTQILTHIDLSERLKLLIEGPDQMKLRYFLDK